MTGNFEVEAYKKPEYEVRVTPSKGRLLAVIYIQHLLLVGWLDFLRLAPGRGVWRLDFGFLMNAEAGKIEAMRLAAIACFVCTVASAQWIQYPTEAVPKGKDGKPNLSAPAPRGSDNKPDFSGM